MLFDFSYAGSVPDTWCVLSKRQYGEKYCGNCLHAVAAMGTLICTGAQRYDFFRRYSYV